MTGKIRIIGGQWRGRKLQVPNQLGLRPTPARLRETLFNWLAMDLPGRCCLDLFAGSGALGIEAASRGAQKVWLIEKESHIVTGLKQQITSLKTNNLEIVCADALNFLEKTPFHFDVAFLDPPFDSPLLKTCCHLLEQKGWLSQDALIYLETDRHLGMPVLPPNWQMIRGQNAGQVSGFLVVRR